MDPAHMTARFVDSCGIEHEVPWLEAAGERRLEGCLPVQRFPVLKGRRVAPGWWWSATDRRLVHYGFKPGDRRTVGGLLLESDAFKC